MLFGLVIGSGSIFYLDCILSIGCNFMERDWTIREVAAYFQESDPQTCLTETAIRMLLRTHYGSTSKKIIDSMPLKKMYGKFAFPIATAPQSSLLSLREWELHFYLGSIWVNARIMSP